MKNSILNKSMRILIITLILIAVAMDKDKSQPVMLTTIILWILITILSIFWNPVKNFIKKCFSQMKEDFPIAEPVSGFHSFQQGLGTASNTVPCTKKTTDTEHSVKNEKMLLHISLRITEKLKSAYPQATWTYAGKPSLSSILAGDWFRIETEHMEEYTHADVRFDRFGIIHITPLTVGEFKTVEAAAENSITKEQASEAKEPPVADVRVWFNLIGRTILEKAITELNAVGHKKLTIKENGDISVRKNKKEYIQATLESFPVKNYWEEFITLLKEYELTGEISGDNISVSWV